MTSAVQSRYLPTSRRGGTNLDIQRKLRFAGQGCPNAPEYRITCQGVISCWLRYTHQPRRKDIPKSVILMNTVAACGLQFIVERGWTFSAVSSSSSSNGFLSTLACDISNLQELMAFQVFTLSPVKESTLTWNSVHGDGTGPRWSC